jgi:hypothetical protein
LGGGLSLLLSLRLEFIDVGSLSLPSQADGFLETVEMAWALAPRVENPFKHLAAKLSATAKALSNWIHGFIGNNKL